jgi:cyclase
MLALLLATCGVAEAQDFANADIRTIPLRGNLRLLKSEGSNIIVSTGRDGTLLVDDEYAELADKLRASLTAFGALPVKTIINTHWHNDHTGGNEALARDGALIIAQENTARRMQSDQTMSLYGKQAAYPPIAWPKLIVQLSLQLRWNDDVVDLLHLGPAHTDGDLVVFFRSQNVLATGDVLVLNEYLPPYFDDLNGGSMEGMIHGANRLLELVNDKTIIVPGHGEPADRIGLLRYRDRVVAIRDQIKAAMSRGLSEDEVVALHPVGDFAGAGKGTDRWVRILYREYRNSR